MNAPEMVPQSFRNTYAERALGEFSDLKNWYEGRLESFGEMTVEDAPLTDGQQWKVEFEGNEAKQIDGAFFTLKGQTVTRYNSDGTVSFRWTQPGLIQKEGNAKFPTPEGEQDIKASGFVGVIKDAEGNTLLTIAQEPFAQTPKKALARTPFQTSVAKLDGLIKGDEKLDPVLFSLLQKLGEGTNDIGELFSQGTVELFPLPYADANRIEATNIGFVTTISDKDLRDSLASNGQNRWCTPQEVSRLARTGLLNGHTAAAVLATS